MRLGSYTNQINMIGITNKLIKVKKGKYNVLDNINSSSYSYS